MNTLKYNEASGVVGPQKNAKLVVNVRICLAAALLFFQSPSVQSGGESEKQLQPIATEIATNTSNESTETVGMYEIIFKDGIKKTLDDLDNIDQIPAGGKMIEYYRNDGISKGKRIRTESVKALGLPDRIDISPKKITNSVTSMNLHLGERVFNIEPWIGKIDAVVLNQNALIIQTTLKDITYDKEENLPRLLFKLWNTPIGKGKKSGFKGSTVREI